MIFHKTVWQGKTRWEARSGNTQYLIVATPSGMFSLKQRHIRDTASLELGLFPTEAHAQDAAEDYHRENFPAKRTGPKKKAKVEEDGVSAK